MQKGFTRMGLTREAFLHDRDVSDGRCMHLAFEREGNTFKDYCQKMALSKAVLVHPL